MATATSAKTSTELMLLSLRLTPGGSLKLEPAPDGRGLDPEAAERLEQAFARGSGHGLWRLGSSQIGRALPPVLAYWRDFGARLVTALCTRPAAEDGAAGAPPPPPPDAELEALAAAIPPMTGAEYASAALLRSLWAETAAAFAVELRESGEALQPFLEAAHPAWHLVGRVHFNLAENRRDEEAPFAFLATYTSRLSAHGKAQHLPLGQALREYANASRKDDLLSLLLPVQRAAERCDWLARMVADGEIYHPLRWSPQEAFRLLSEAPLLEQAGVTVRMPAGWHAGRPPRPRVGGKLETKTPGLLGRDALLDFRAEISLDGEPLSPEEIETLLSQTHGLALVRGRWVEIDPERMARALRRFEEVERLAREQGLPFGEAMRLLAGAGIGSGETGEADPDWASVTAGPGLAGKLAALRSPEALARVAPGPDLKGTLRPYQEVGLRWLHLLAGLGLGACLADDMGLGKTIQLLALLLVLKRARGPRPSLLVAPASLLGNWTAEIERFAPSLSALVAHPSELSGEELGDTPPAGLAATDLVLTTYGTLLRVPWLQKASWRLAVLDEAQAIKNPAAKQARAVKKLDAEARIALTGTPIENRLSDLWSIFDFLNPGLLGSAEAFKAYAKRLGSQPGNSYAPLRELVRPYVLRRLKTDRSIIADLPEKTEVKAFCPSSKKQVALYRQAVDELQEGLEAADGMKRRGLVLAFLMRFKQICNHPSQWLGDGAWAEADGGKWGRLREIAEVVAAKQEKALVFTQFREVVEPLAAFLAGVFGRPGLVLHGDTPVARRRELVRRFQEDEAVPFFVLSLKAGGSGLNLTAASHVVHFDRWWNPAVENQATDRAFRIGQKKNVLVHKLICRGTVEERIDALIESKKDLARELLEGGAELNLTELSNEALLDLVRLDLAAATGE